jgi:hypothetical protein
MKGLSRLCDLRVLEFQPKSEWGLPTFIPKKLKTVKIITNFGGVNKQLVRKSSFTQISPVLQELEGFTLATALDLSIIFHGVRTST